MTEVRVRGRVLDLPAELTSASAVDGFRSYLTSTGEMSTAEASRFTLLILGTIMTSVGEWYALTVGRHIEAVLNLRTQLRGRYVEVLELMRAGHTGELPQRLQPEAFHDLFAQLAAHVDGISSPREAIVQHVAEVPLDEWLRGQDATGVDEPHAPPDEPIGLDPHDDTLDERGVPDIDREDRDPWRPPWLLSGDADAERTYSNDVNALGRRRGDIPAATRGAAPATPARAFAEAMADRLVLHHLRPAGIEVTAVATQPTFGPFLAAESNLSALDPVRELGYEIRIRVPGELVGLAGEEWVQPDGYAFSGGTFDFLEYKSHETPPPNGFFSGRSALEMTAELELRGRLAARIPSCTGWRYRVAIPEMARVFDWAFRTLQGRGSAPPEFASPDFVNAVNALAAVPSTAAWAHLMRAE